MVEINKYTRYNINNCTIVVMYTQEAQLSEETKLIFKRNPSASKSINEI